MWHLKNTKVRIGLIILLLVIVVGAIAVQVRGRKQPTTKSGATTKQSYVTTRYGLSLQGVQSANAEDTYALVVQFDDSYMKQSR